MKLKRKETKKVDSSKIKNTASKVNPKYEWCGKTLECTGIEKGDSIEDIILKLDAKACKKPEVVSYWILENTDGDLLDSGQIDIGQTETITAPDSQVIIQYSDGTPITTETIPSGDTETIIVPVIPCEDAEYTLLDEDGNEISSGSIASGDSENIIAPDATYTQVDSLGSTLSSGSINSGGSATIASPDSTYTQVNSLGSTISSGSIVSGGSATITAPDSNLVVNGGSPIAIPSGDTYNLTVTKEWILQFINQTDIIQVVANVGNIATFASGSGSNVGTVEVSTDGVTYSPLVFPFFPSVGIWYFKRSSILVTGVYTISE